MKRVLLLILLAASVFAGCAKPDISACSEPNLYAWSLLAGPMYSETIATMKAASGEQQDPAAYAQVIQNLDAEIATLQERKEDAAFIGTPTCLEPSRAAHVDALDLSIAALEERRRKRHLLYQVNGGSTAHY